MLTQCSSAADLNSSTAQQQETDVERTLLKLVPVKPLIVREACADLESTHSMEFKGGSGECGK